MQTFFESGRAIDLVLAVIAVEAVVVFLLRARLDLRGFFLNLASGTCLMLALRGALTGGGFVAVAPFLIGSFLIHLADLALRWRRGPRG